MRWLSSILVAIAVLLNVRPSLAGAGVQEQNWPQWRGPLANGVAPTANPPVTWSETNNVRWKVEIPGNGSATPIIWGNQIFIETAVNTGKKPQIPPVVVVNPQAATGGGGASVQVPTEIHQWLLLCLDRQTGKVLWKKIAREGVPHEGHHQDSGFASCSPVTDGKNLYAYFGSHGLYCYDLQGNLRWQKDLGRMQTRNGFGEGTSPALVGNAIVVNWDHEGDDDFIVALDKETGKELWRQPRVERTTWTSPFILEYGGRSEIIIASATKVRSYDPATGKIIWECAGLGDNPIATPVTGHGLVFAASGYTRPALLAIRLGRTGDLTDTDAVAWKLNRGTPYVASPLLYGDLIYLFAERNAILSCYDARTGRPHFTEERLSALNGIYASPVAAAGRVYFVGRNGATLVIKPSEKLETLATNKLDERIDASPVLVGNELFLRGRKHLYCIVEKSNPPS